MYVCVSLQFYSVRHFYTKCTAQARAQARVAPKLVVFLHSTAESGRLSSNSLSPELEAWHSSRMHADLFINDGAYGSIGLIILYMSCICFLYIRCVSY